MAVQQSQVLPAPFIEEAGKDYLSQLKGLTSVALDTSKFSPTVASQDPLQTQAATLAADTGATGLGGYQQYLTAAQNLTGPQAYKPYMTPYQTDVIDATLTEYDKQTQLQEQGLRDQQAKLGVLGAGRAGVQLGEYGSQRGLDRAALQARMLQDAFTQAQGLAQADYGQQMNLAQLQPQLAAGRINTLGQVGARQQAQEQATLDATREQNRMAAMEPYERIGTYGSGVGSMISGYPGRSQFTATPNPTPLQTALGIGTFLGGAFLGRPRS
tara:strand:- start:763 stop:1572 length:810 start_codon:yes stop_codon:yes gene_type:complete